MLKVREPVVLTHPDGYRVVPTRADRYAADDPLVRAFPWAFVDEGAEIERPVERATRKPGERRGPVR